MRYDGASLKHTTGHSTQEYLWTEKARGFLCPHLCAFSLKGPLLQRMLISELYQMENLEDGRANLAPEPYSAEAVAEAAQAWRGYGVDVIPLVANTVQAAVPVKRWIDDLDVKELSLSWQKHCHDDVGFQVGQNLIVFRAKSQKSRLAFGSITQEFNVMAKQIHRSADGIEYFFWRNKGTTTTFAAMSNLGHPDRIDVLTGADLVPLPPSGGRVSVVQASNTGDLDSVGQAFVDAVGEYNKELPYLPDENDDDMAPADTQPSTPISLPAEQEEDGETGEPGGQAAAIALGTAFARVAAFGSPSLESVNACAIPAAVTTPVAPTIANAATVSSSVPCDGNEAGSSGSSTLAHVDTVASAAVGVQEPASVTDLPTASDESAIGFTGDDDEVLLPKAAENPVISALKSRGLYRTPLGSGLHDITCPWASEHADGAHADATYFEADEFSANGRFRCKDASHGQYTIKELLEFLGVPKMDARNKAVIRIVAGDLHFVLDAAEKELAKRGKYYQAGGLIVSIRTDPNTGNPSIVPTSVQTLTRELSVAATWEKYEKRSDSWVPTDPPSRHVTLLDKSTNYRYLPPLVGIARQPYFCEADGTLVTEPGYNQISKIFAVFDLSLFAMPEPTLEAAMQALALLEDLLCEFHFSQPSDKSTALSAIFTAATRISLPHAPAFHAKAHDIGSGKTYLNELIAAFASPAPSAKVSYPSSSTEATKVILALLLTSPAVVDFDDMDSDWLPHGSMKRMLTSQFMSERVLGYSKTATVSTSALFLGSGNNVGPSGDMRRRVATINLDPQHDTPATIEYKGNPVATVLKNRGLYVAAILTIIAAWRKAGSPRAKVSSVATYGVWADYCRHPLIWLGLADPATSLLEQVAHDPDSDPLIGLLSAWLAAVGSNATPIRKAIELTRNGHADLLDAIRECSVEERGEINRTKLGWFLKKNAGRIVNGMKFVEAQADGRKAWKVVVVNPQALAPAAKPMSSAPENDPDYY